MCKTRTGGWHWAFVACGVGLVLLCAARCGADVVSRNATSPRPGPRGGAIMVCDYRLAAAMPFSGESQFFQKLLDTSDFPPRWRCGVWTPRHGWLHIASDAGIWLAYTIIPAALIWFVRRRPDMPYRGLFWLFAAFIIACGLTHLMELVVFWWPAYRLMGVVKAGTAIISLTTAVVLIPVIPHALALRSPAVYQREIDQRRQVELELKHVHAQLEGVIELRTNELAQKTEEMEQFLHTVSHDLKSPIVTCLGLTGMLREDVGEGRIDDLADTTHRIDHTINRMRRLIEDLLHLSRVGRVEYEFGQVDMQALFAAIATDLQPRVQEAGATLTIHEGLPTVTADAKRLTDVFENLLTNAIKYGCDAEDPRITVGCVTTDTEHRFFVRDNGNGIDADQQARLFEPFRRLQSDKEGTGMGLAIVAKVLKVHGGRAWIESAPGKGATFWCSLPSNPAVKQVATATTNVAGSQTI